MPTPHNKRLLIARLNGLTRTVERYTGAGRKRLDNARPIVLGDGTSRVHFLHDPAAAPDAVTLGIVITRDDPFVVQAKQLFEQHRLDPTSAEPVVLLAFSDAAGVVATETLTRAVIQEIRFPEGDTNTSGESMMEIIVQPSDNIT